MLRTEVENRNGVQIWRSALLSNKGLFHGFTTRKGGVSPPPFDSLNLGLTAGDLSSNVVENRKRFEREYGVALRALAWQVHGDEVLVLKEGEALPEEPGLPNADAIIGNARGLCMAMFFADCLPVYFWDPVRGAGGIAHAGWRSTVADIAGKTVRAMNAAFGTAPEDLLVALGPSIGPCCFEVQSDVENLFIGKFGESVRGRRNGKIYIDLWEANKLSLKGKGVKMEKMEVAGLCTFCSGGLFFSYRREKGKTGRMAGFIRLSQGVEKIGKGGD